MSLALGAGPAAAAGARSSERSAETGGGPAAIAATVDSAAGPSRADSAAAVPGAETRSQDGGGARIGPRQPVAARADTARGGGRTRHAGSFDSPRWVMLRCLALPGWGQFANRAWLKGLVLGGADGYLRVRAVTDQRVLRDLEPRVSEARANFSRADDAVSTTLAALQAAEASGDSALIAQAEVRYGAALAGRLAAAAGYNGLASSYNALLNGQVGRLWLLGGVLVYALVDAYVDAHFRNFKIEFERDPALPGGLPPSGQTRLSLRWSF